MRVSVLMPAYNAARHIAQAIESVLAQTHADFEFIIINDGSTDGTRAIVENYVQRDQRIRLLNQSNKGPGAAMNVGLNTAKHEWIVVMHADDVMLPHRIERQLAFVQEHPEIAVASSFVYNINDAGTVIAKFESPLVSKQAVEETLRRNDIIGFHHPAVIMRKAIVQELGGYRETLQTNEDIDLWNRVAERGYLILVQPEFLLKYRIHASAASIAKSRLVQLQLRWVKSCMVARRNRLPEPSWEEFLEERSLLSPLKRLAQERKELAKVLYKAAVFHYANRNYPLLLVYVMAAVSLQPEYVLRQIQSKYVNPKAFE